MTFSRKMICSRFTAEWLWELLRMCHITLLPPNGRFLRSSRWQLWRGSTVFDINHINNYDASKVALSRYTSCNWLGGFYTTKLQKILGKYENRRLLSIYEKGLGYQLTNNKKVDSSIVSCANCVNRNTGVHSIFNYSVVKHAWTAATDRLAIKVEVILGFRTGVCLAVQSQNTVTKYCPVTRNGCEGCGIRCIFKKREKLT